MSTQESVIPELPNWVIDNKVEAKIESNYAFTSWSDVIFKSG
jgi:hypothetical protein